jgi:hypothetical protein
MRTLRSVHLQPASAGVIAFLDRAVARQHRVGAGALTQHEELYRSWNSFLNPNIIAKKGVTV